MEYTWIVRYKTLGGYNRRSCGKESKLGGSVRSLADLGKLKRLPLTRTVEIQV
ncbi:hypothetical protein [Enterococcus phage PEF1]